MTRRGITAALLAAAALTLALTSCTATPARLPTPTPTTTAHAVPGLPKGVVPAKIPTAVPNDPAARQNVTLTTCQKTDGGWKATGTARNPGDHATSYDITVFFTTETATVINTAQTKVTIKAGGTATWTAAQTFTPPAKTLCVLRGVA